MIVRAQPKGRGATGLYIGARNARRNFKRCATGVDLQLGHIQIHCTFPPEFWQGQPEIFDTRLSSWLEAKVFHERSCRSPIPMLMIPAEKNSFRLHPIKLPSVATDRLIPTERLVNSGAATIRVRKSEKKINGGTAAWPASQLHHLRK
jgi:hypothetical protein